MAPPASADKVCPVSGKAGVCPVMAAAMAARKAKEEEETAPPPTGEELLALVQAGEEHLANGEDLKAFKAFAKANDADPTNEAAVCGRVEAMCRLSRQRGALKVCEKGLEVLPECAWLLATRDRLREEVVVLDAELDAKDAEIYAARAAAAAAAAEAEADHADSTTDDSEEATSPGGGGGGCPACRSQAEAKRDAEELRRRPRKSAALEAALTRLDTEASVPFRLALRQELTEFYREFYRKYSTKNVDTSQYTKDEKRALSITEGHKHMPRPDKVEVPDDWQEHVGTLTPEELRKYDCNSKRMLICVYGDLFDVSDRPDKYGAEGPYNTMTGRDITFALWSGYDDEAEWDKYYDVFQAKPRDEMHRRMQGLVSWWTFFEEEYGDPVGRLSVYERDWELPAPPKIKDLCSVM